MIRMEMCQEKDIPLALQSGTVGEPVNNNIASRDKYHFIILSGV